MSQNRRTYQLTLTLNAREFSSVVIDPHYEENHPDINDPLIIELVKKLHGRHVPIEAVKDQFSYLKVLETWNEKRFRVILTYCAEPFLGVVNVFRVKD